MKEFSDAGIVDAQQIVDINGNFKSYDEIATEYDLISNNRSFIENIISVSYICSASSLAIKFRIRQPKK